MKKMSTLFIKDENDLSKVVEGIYNEENKWVFDEGVKATRKWDGTAVSIIDKKLYKRYDSKINKKTGLRKEVPKGAIPCQSPDKKSGHWPHWLEVNFNYNQDKYIIEAYNNLENKNNGTYEACGPKINGNNENLNMHILIKHGNVEYDIKEVLNNPKEFMRNLDIEGIVFHHPDGRMCKIRKCDFGMIRKVD